MSNLIPFDSNKYLGNTFNLIELFVYVKYALNINLFMKVLYIAVRIFRRNSFSIFLFLKFEQRQFKFKSMNTQCSNVNYIDTRA